MRAAEAPAAPARPRGLPFRGVAFGLGILADRDVPATPAAEPPLRTVACTTVPRRSLERATTGGARDALVELLHPDGRTFMRIDRVGTAFEVYAPRHGMHLVAADGAAIASALPSGRPERTQRLFFAQALPLACTLQGLEPLHASAVEAGGRAIAFAAASGTGKSTLAAHAVSLGAGFVADDVVALELDGGTVVAHAGPPRASIAPEEAAAVAFGAAVPDGDKLLARPVPAAASLPLGLVVRLVRGSGRRPRLRPLTSPLGRTLLAASFLPYLRTPERLLNQLSLHAALASTVPVLELELAGPPAAAAELVLRHAAELP